MLIDLLRNRRSIRRYQQRPIEQEKLDLLIEVALRAPSSRGLNPWEFYLVTNPELIGRLAQAKPHGSAFVAQAPLVFVICADPEKCDVWIEDCSIATLLLHLAAVDLGLGSCWVQLRLREHASGRSAERYVAELLDLPKDFRVEAMVAIGYPEEDKPGRTILPVERIHRLA